MLGMDDTAGMASLGNWTSRGSAECTAECTAGSEGYSGSEGAVLGRRSMRKVRMPSTSSASASPIMA